MSDIKNIFISHIHENDELLPKLKDLIGQAGMDVRDGSINSEKPNEAKDPEYIKTNILAPRIDWASALVVLIDKDTHTSWWVNWEIEYAISQGKRVIGVYAQGATEANIPDMLQKLGDSAIVGWQSQQIVDALNSTNSQKWEDPASGNDRNPEWQIKRYTCP